MTSPCTIHHFRWFKKHSRTKSHQKGLFRNCVARINKQNIYQYYILLFMIIIIFISRNIQLYLPINKNIILNNYNVIFFKKNASRVTIVISSTTKVFHSALLLLLVVNMYKIQKQRMK